jgi:hypothetical protein
MASLTIILFLLLLTTIHFRKLSFNLRPEGRRPLGRPRRRWEDGVRMDLREIGLGRGWIGFDWLRTGTGDGLL